MKRNFGNWLSRLFRSGAVLSPLEYDLLVALVRALPLPMRSIVIAQFESYNLVQREIDGRALNFYRMRNGRPNDMQGLPLLRTARIEAPLMRISATIEGEREPIHAVLTAVEGRAFCVSLSRRVHHRIYGGIRQVTRVEQAWRSVVSNVKSAGLPETGIATG